MQILQGGGGGRTLQNNQSPLTHSGWRLNDDAMFAMLAILRANNGSV